MEPRREARCSVLGRVVALFGVARQTVAHELAQRRGGRGCATRLGRDRHGVVDRQRRESARIAIEECVRRARPARLDRGRDLDRPPDARNQLERRRVRPLVQVRSQALLQAAPERVRGRERVAAARAHGPQAVRVDRLEAHRDPLGRAGHHARQEEAGPVVGHDRDGLRRQRGQETRARAGFGLDVGEVRNARRRARVAVRAHAVEDEAVDAVAVPAMARAQGLEHEPRPAVLARQLDGAVEREVPGRAPVGRHPVQDVLPLRADRVRVARADAHGRDALDRLGHRDRRPRAAQYGEGSRATAVTTAAAPAGIAAPRNDTAPARRAERARSPGTSPSQGPTNATARSTQLAAGRS